MPTEVRQCFICMEETDVTEEEESDWVSPCQCTGTIRWVHQRCIRTWVLMQEKTNDSRPFCAQCLTPYRISSEKGWLITAHLFWCKTLFPWFRYVAGSLMRDFLVQVGCTVVGTIGVFQIYGIDTTFQMIEQASPEEALPQLHLVGVSLLAFGLAPFSTWFLKALRFASCVPVIKYILPRDVPRPRSRFEPRRRFCVARSLTAAIFLPTCANLTGKILFSDQSCTAKRVFMGGAIFLAVKGLQSMYLQQKLMVRRCSLMVHDYTTVQ